MYFFGLRGEADSWPSVASGADGGAEPESAGSEVSCLKTTTKETDAQTHELTKTTPKQKTSVQFALLRALLRLFFPV